MAPEQATQAQLTPASDWYAAGVILYEALTGELPFPGMGVDVLIKKLNDDPPIPSTLAPGIPLDLNVLCMELLSRAPEHRPSGETVIERLAEAGRSASAPTPVIHDRPRGDSAFVGRASQLAELEKAFARSAAGRPTMAFVKGPSGMGKTAVVNRFLGEIVRREGAIVFEGRCYERESLPYKGLDSVIDRLTRYLAGLGRLEVEALLPRDVRALAGLFPVLDRVAAIADAPTRRTRIPDQREIRSRAFTALKELLGRIGDRHPLVVFIDDLQWGDVDSAALLMDLMRPPEPPAMLLVGCYRSEDEDTSPLITEILGVGADQSTRRISLEKPAIITVDALAPEESRTLARRLGTQTSAIRIADHSGGNPFLLEALARHGDEGADIDTMLGAEVDRLPAPAKALLEIVSVAARPVRTEVALRAAGIDGEEETSALKAATAAHVLRTVGQGVMLVTYHDRVREAVVRALDPDSLAERHRSLALTLELLDPTAHYALYVHFLEAGDFASAMSYAAIAGDEAAASLAFDRAAALYAAALEGSPRGAVERRVLLTKRASALANAARGAAAAKAYLEAARDAPPSESLQFRHLAAQQFLIAGRLGAGLTTLQTVLQDVGLKLADTPQQAWDSVIELRQKLIDRGLDFEERGALDPTERLRIDILASVAVSFLVIDTVRGADFQLRHLHTALDSGDPACIARALALEASYIALSGGEQRERHRTMTKRAVAMAKKLKDPRAIGTCALSLGLSAYLLGDWRRALAQFEATQKLLRNRCTGVSWELTTARTFSLTALYFAGDLRGLLKRTPEYLEDAIARGDLYASSAARLGHVTSYWLVIDQPDEITSALDELTDRWPKDRFFLQHALEAMSRVKIDLYQGRPAQARARLLDVWPKLVASKLERVQYMRIDWLCARARCAIACGDVDSAMRDVAALEAEQMRWSDGLATLMRGMTHIARGDDDAAVTALEAAVLACDDADMKLHAAVARWRLGEVIGGERGRDLQQSAETWMYEQGVRNPAGMLSLVAPALTG